MADRLSALDVSFLYFEDTTTPMHVGSVAIFQPDGGDHAFDYEALVQLIEDRISLVPRYRQVVHKVPGNLAPRSGRRRGLRRHLSRPSLGTAPAGHRRAA